MAYFLYEDEQGTQAILNMPSYFDPPEEIVVGKPTPEFSRQNGMGSKTWPFDLVGLCDHQGDLHVDFDGQRLLKVKK